MKTTGCCAALRARLRAPATHTEPGSATIATYLISLDVRSNCHAIMRALGEARSLARQSSGPYGRALATEIMHLFARSAFESGLLEPDRAKRALASEWPLLRHVRVARRSGSSFAEVPGCPSEEVRVALARALFARATTMQLLQETAEAAESLRDAEFISREPTLESGKDTRAAIIALQVLKRMYSRVGVSREGAVSEFVAECVALNSINVARHVEQVATVLWGSFHREEPAFARAIMDLALVGLSKILEDRFLVSKVRQRLMGMMGSVT